jgi:hypothetical protein
MNREDIIRMAREAGFAVRKFGDKDQVMEGDNYHIQTDEIERFAALVAAAEREACAKVCEEQSERWALPVNSADYRLMWGECAAAIRARGQE